MAQDIAASEKAFSFPVKVAHIALNPVTVTVSADERERAALARLWKVEAVEELGAELQLARWKRDGVRVKGSLKARIIQACVVTLEPVEAMLAEDFEQIFVPEGSKLARIATTGAGDELVLDPEGPDLPETFAGDSIDVGAMVTEFAALAIDPYPRKPDAAFSDSVVEDAEEDSGKPNPFAVLKNWKKDQGQL